jgi:hypothetical protein
MSFWVVVLLAPNITINSIGWSTDGSKINDYEI